MLLDTLAIAAGFIGVILLLSLAVTALVEAAQSVFMLRRRILRDAMRDLFIAALNATNNGPATNNQADATTDGADAPDARSRIESVIGAAFAVRWFGRHPRALNALTSAPDIETAAAIVPRVAINEKDLDGLATTIAGRNDPAYAQSLKRLFPLMEKRSTELFKRDIRVITVFASLIVAIVMQVSTPDLLRRLTKDPAYRAAALAVAERVANEDGAEWVLEPRDYSDAAAHALGVLAQRHPELREVFEPISGAGGDLAFILDELDRELAREAPDRRAAVLNEYRELIEAEAGARLSAAVAQIDDVVGQLALLDITPWRNGGAFYADSRNVIGVLITALLLTFGAPFWFDVLRKVIGLLQTVRGGQTTSPRPRD